MSTLTLQYSTHLFSLILYVHLHLWSLHIYIYISLNFVFTEHCIYKISAYLVSLQTEGFRKKFFVHPVYNSLQLFHIIELKTMNHEQNEY